MFNLVTQILQKFFDLYFSLAAKVPVTVSVIFRLPKFLDCELGSSFQFDK